MKNEATDTAETAAIAEQAPQVAPEKASSKKGATRKKGAPKGRKTAKEGKAKSGKAKAAAPKKGARAGKKAGAKAAKPAATRKSGTPRAESKGAKILEMIGRAKGATLAEIMKAAGWQAHSVRGFISTAGKKHGVTIESTKSENGDRVYRAAK